MTEKNEQLNLTVDKLGINGEGIATLLDGMKIFVPFCLSGEVITAQVLAVKKNFAYGKLLEVRAPSDFRQTPVCAVFGKCGGCQLQHLKYDEQAKWKQVLVQETLSKVGHIDVLVNPTVTSEPYGYRNKIQLPVGVTADGHNVMGFYRPNSHNIVDITTCPLHGEWAEKLMEAVRAYLMRAQLNGYDERTRSGHVRHVVARYLDSKLLVCIVTPVRTLMHAEILVEELALRFENFSLLHNVNLDDTNVILGKKTELIYGAKVLCFDWLGLGIELAIESFLQVNTEVASRLYCDAVALAGVSQEDVVIDAYSGAGVMSAMFAKKAKKVYGIEICAEAVRDAIALAKRNNITNIEHKEADCAIALPTLARRVRREIGDAHLVIVLDPPRKGCDTTVLDAVLSAKPHRIVYISCNTASLARDLSVLGAGDYKVAHVMPYDMFPETSNVETLVVLERKGHLEGTVQ